MLTALIGLSLNVQAKENSSIVTLGQDLSDIQKDMMLKYFETDERESQVLIVTNDDEYKYLEGIATKSQIGKHAYSCCYIEPRQEGGLDVTTYNLNWVTADMIKNALVTSGITNCKVIAAAPMEVSGTGALTGVFKAYSMLGGKEKLDIDKMKAASEELIITGELAEDVGDEEATEMVETLKEIIIQLDEQDKEVDIPSLIDEYILDKGLKINEEHREKIINFLIKISDLDYDIDQIEKAYGKLKANYETIKKYATNVKDSVEKTKSIIDKITDWLIEKFNRLKEWWNNFSERHQNDMNNYDNTWGIFHRLQNKETTVESTEEATESTVEAVEITIEAVEVETETPVSETEHIETESSSSLDSIIFEG